MSRSKKDWIVFDEQFKYVSASSGFEQVGTDQEFKVHVRNDVTISKSGYLSTAAECPAKPCSVGQALCGFVKSNYSLPLS
ncbi:MAG: hypothetical protein SFU87_09120 [Chitinophagaceae bacterium]|nr:hypothetical protein [Chitinophagaceae bacterium]